MSKNQPYFPLKEELTDRQIGPLLAVLRELSPFLLEPTREPGSTPTADKLDGGVESAAATTFLKTCARLDFLIDDSSRWNLKGHNTLISEMVKTQKAQQKFIDAQRQSSENLQAPHFLLRPTLGIGGKGYLAWWGDIKTAGGAIIGQGRTPEEALLDFDDAFQRTPEEQIYVVAEAAGVKLDKPPTP